MPAVSEERLTEGEVTVCTVAPSSCTSYEAAFEMALHVTVAEVVVIVLSSTVGAGVSS